MAEEEVELENILLACEKHDGGEANSETELSDTFENEESGWPEGDDDENF